MPTIHLISAAPGDHVPGHELASPDCPEYLGLLERPDVQAWMDTIGYGPEAEDELIYLVTDDDDLDAIPAGFEHLTIEL
ncbi:hypothetical protein [Kitasatospora sp. NPDC057738]|uniref:hypothetical protein n=1 Tax=Kitasatospora sp. NPDC057738 TaxID=3346233 RepID=UPI003690E24C